MEGYMAEIQRVGVIDNDDMRELAFYLMNRSETKKLDPREMFYLV
jgi:hypothetical protein